VSKERRIPKSAVKPLILYCERLSGETGRSAAEIFKEYLELMNKYGEYFFSEPWPEKVDKPVGFRFGDEDVNFIEGAEGYEEECERFTLVCLRRNISMEGFDAEGFDEDFKFYGHVECWDCVVPEAVRLREHIKLVEQAVREYEEEVKQENPSWVAREMCEYYKRSDVVRRDRMMCVELRLYEEMGGAKGKNCGVKNKYRCPYGAKSGRLIEHGRLVKFIWRQIEWYDHHWNLPQTYRPSEQDMKWYHYGEPGIMDVTSYDDIMKAIEDGRFEKIVKEHERYMKETGSEAWALS